MTEMAPSASKPTLPLAKALLVAGLCALVAAMFAVFFGRLPIAGTSLALDWRGFYHGIEGGRLIYHPTLHNPPWSLIVLLPLGWLSFQASWGILTFLTLGILVASVPPARLGIWAASVLAVTASFPAIRHFADGNLEGEVIAGCLLLLAAHRSRNGWLWIAGLLLATAKVQEVWLFLLLLGATVVRHGLMRRFLYPTLAAAIVAIGSVWLFGREWFSIMWNIPFKNTVVNMSLPATLTRLEVSPVWIGLAWISVATVTIWLSGRLPSARKMATISRPKAGLWIAASTLLAPYVAANSYLTLLAIGIIPLFQERPMVGLALLAAVNLPYLALLLGKPTWLYSEYWTLVAALSWLALAWQIHTETGRAAASDR